MNPRPPRCRIICKGGLMYTTGEDVKALEEKFGRPYVTDMRYEIRAAEFDIVKSSMGRGRAHDVTMFIRNRERPDDIVVIRKPFFPAGAFRAPSGAAEKGEGLEAGAVREGREETGLDIGIERYLVRVNAVFSNEGRRIEWTTHVFEAGHAPGQIDPIDKEEIAQARWASLDELQGPIRQVLLDTGWGLFGYRVALTDLVVDRLGAKR